MAGPGYQSLGSVLLPVDLTSQVRGILPVANGGTGGSSGPLPDQSGHAGQFLQTDGLNLSWQALDVGTF